MSYRSDKTTFKENFFAVAAIIGFIVDSVALFHLFPIGFSFEGGLEINPIQRTEIVISLGSFHMSEETLTGYIILIGLVSIVFVLSYFDNYMSSFLSENITNIVVGALNFTILWWFVTFGYIYSVSFLILVILGISFPLLFLITKFLGERLQLFLGIILLILISIVEVGVFRADILWGFVYPFSAIVIGAIIFSIEISIIRKTIRNLSRM